MRFQALAVEIADADRGVDAQHARRLLRYDADGAAFGVAPEQGAFGAAGHLDVIDVDERSAQPLGAAQIDPVDINPDALVAVRLVGVGHRTDAARRNDQGGVADEERLDPQRRDGAVGQVGQGLDVAVGQIVLAEGGNRDRRALQVGVALLRRDDDFGQAAAVLRRGGLGVLSLRHARSGPHQGAGDRKPGGRGSETGLHRNALAPSPRRPSAWLPNAPKTSPARK